MISWSHSYMYMLASYKRSLTHHPSSQGWASMCPVFVCGLGYWVGFLFLRYLLVCYIYACIFVYFCYETELLGLFNILYYQCRISSNSFLASSGLIQPAGESIVCVLCCQVHVIQCAYYVHTCTHTCIHHGVY